MITALGVSLLSIVKDRWSAQASPGSHKDIQSAPEYGLIVWSRPKKEGAMKATNRFSVHFVAIVLLSLLLAMPLSVRAACLTGLNAADCDLLNAATADVS